MPILWTALSAAGWQLILVALKRYGEVDTFWFWVLEVPSILLSLIALIGAWFLILGEQWNRGGE